MPLSDYQTAIDGLVAELQTPYWAPLSQLARLMEETGELARIYNHKYGDKVKKATEAPDDMADEMGDIIYTVMCMANLEGIDLDAALQKVITKSRTRDKDRFPKKAS